MASAPNGLRNGTELLRMVAHAVFNSPNLEALSMKIFEKLKIDGLPSLLIAKDVPALMGELEKCAQDVESSPFLIGAWKAKLPTLLDIAATVHKDGRFQRPPEPLEQRQAKFCATFTRLKECNKLPRAAAAAFFEGDRFKASSFCVLPNGNLGVQCLLCQAHERPYSVAGPQSPYNFLNHLWNKHANGEHPPTQESTRPSKKRRGERSASSSGSSDSGSCT